MASTQAVLLVASLAVTGAGTPQDAAHVDDARLEAAREAAHQRYTSQLLATLETSVQPRELLLAARLRRTQAWQAGKRGDGMAQMRQESTADALLQRAVQRGVDDPVVWWEVANACRLSPALCASDDPVTRLRELAPSNAAVWIRPRLGATSGDEAEVRLARIAAASRYDTYLGERVRAWTVAQERVPMPPELVQELGADETTSRGALVFAFVTADVVTDATELRGLCGDSALAAAGEPRETACRAALDRALEKADSPLSYYAAWRARHALETDPMARATLERARATVEWQVAAMFELTVQGEPKVNDAAQAEQFEFWLTPGATEFSVLRELLQAHGVALTPPPDWRGARAIEPVRRAVTP
jgi:hypothetical protein